VNSTVASALANREHRVGRSPVRLMTKYSTSNWGSSKH